VVPLTSLWLYANSLLFSDDNEPFRALRRGLQERWAAILPFTPDQRRVSWTTAELAPAVEAAFRAPGPGWAGACYQSPDVMLAAASVEAIARGEVLYVLGELHPGVNTLRSAFFGAQHPAPDNLLEATRRDLPEPQVLIVATRGEGGATLRICNSLVDARDWRLLYADDSCGVPTGQPLPVSALVVDREAGGLAVRTRDGRLCVDVMEALGELLSYRLINHFDILPPADHRPRISVDRLVVRREQWRFAAADLPFARVADEAERYLGVRRWKRASDLPRFVFVRTPREAKPFCIDLDSIVSADVLSRAIRRAGDDGALTVTEMLPDPSQAWLPDADDQRYTCELRIVAVDQG
jgi:hypothetical protein